MNRKVPGEVFPDLEDVVVRKILYPPASDLTPEELVQLIALSEPENEKADAAGEVPALTAIADDLVDLSWTGA